MKNKFFITGLVLSILVVGCCNKTDGVPTKTKYSHEVTYAEFDEKLDNIFGTDVFDGGFSFITKSKLSIQNNLKLVDEKDAKIGNATSKANYEYSGKYDNNNDVSFVSTVGTIKTNIVLNGEKQSDKDSANFSRQYQSTGGEEAKTVSVNQKAKEVYFLGAYDDNEPASQPVKVLALPILFFAFGTMNFDSKTPEEKAKWKFYIDSGVYTAVFTENTFKEKTQYIDGQDVKYADETKQEIDLIQIKGKKDGDKLDYLSVYFEMKSDVSTTYVSNYDDDGFVFEAGQTLLQKATTSIGTKITSSNVTLEKIDLTGYHVKDVDEESEEHDIFHL